MPLARHAKPAVPFCKLTASFSKLSWFCSVNVINAILQSTGCRIGLDLRRHDGCSSLSLKPTANPHNAHRRKKFLKGLNTTPPSTAKSEVNYPNQAGS